MSYLDIARRVLDNKTRDSKNPTKETKKVLVSPAATASASPQAAVAGIRIAASPPAELPAEWIAGVDHLRRIACPIVVRPDRWRQIVTDAGRFLDDWGAQAAVLGWGTPDLFGAHRTKPIERLDCAGLVLLLHGDELVALTAEAGRIRTRSGSLLTYYRRALTPAVPLWQLGGGKP